MTKKHFQLVAAALLQSKPEEHWDPNKKAQYIVTVNRIADAFANEFPRFDRDRFISACGLMVD